MNVYIEYRPLVLKHAVNYHRSLNRSHELDDLISEGMATLWKCTKSYRPNNGVTFGLFASNAIENTFKALIAHAKRKNRMLGYGRGSMSLDTDDGDTEMMDIRDDYTPSPFQVLRIKEVLSEINKLPGKQRQVMLGICNDEIMEETGERIGVSRQRVEQLQNAAIDKIKRSFSQPIKKHVQVQSS